MTLARYAVVGAFIASVGVLAALFLGAVAIIGLTNPLMLVTVLATGGAVVLFPTVMGSGGDA